MLHVTILMVGKTREAFIQEGLAFYEKRLQPFLHLTLKSVREEKEAAGLTAAAVKLREGQRLQAQIPPRAFVPPSPPKAANFPRKNSPPGSPGWNWNPAPSPSSSAAIWGWTRGPWPPPPSAWPWPASP